MAGKKVGQTSADEITIFKATELAIEDIATAYKMYQMEKERGIG